MRAFRVGMAAAAVAAIGFSGSSVVAADSPAAVAVTGSPVRPGGAVTVSGEGCTGPDSIVLVGVLDSDSESDLAVNAVSPAANGSWSASLSIGSQVAPGTYPVAAKCTNYDGYSGGYDGYEGYEGYDGSGGFDYARGAVVVLPPLDEPESDGDLTVTPNTIAVGETAVVEAIGFDGGEQVTVVLYSEPVVLASGRADSAGEFTATIRIPLGTVLGAHTVYAMNAESALHESLVLSGAITVVADTTNVTTTSPSTVVPTTVDNAVQDATDVQNSGSLAVTGFTVLPFATLAVALIVLGFVLRRRARNHTSNG